MKKPKQQRYSFIIKPATANGRARHKVVETSLGFNSALNKVLALNPGKPVVSHLKYLDRMNPEIKEYVNSLVKRFPCVFLRFHNGKVYLLIEHWRTINPEDSKAVLLGSSRVPVHNSLRLRDSSRIQGAKVLYLTDPIPRTA